MRKTFALFVFSLLLAACAGNPPAWWTPNPAGSVSAPRSSERTQTAKPQAVQSDAETETAAEPAEETLAPLPDESYEEMILTPLQDEETENETGDSSAQTVPAEEPAQTAPAPADPGALPPPSVLE